VSSVVVAPGRAVATAEAPASRPRAAHRRLTTAVSSRVYLPAFVVPAVAVVLIAAGFATNWGGMDFAGSVTSLRVVVAGPLTLAIIGVFLVVERVRPAQRRPLIARGHRHDVLFLLLSVTVLVPLITALTLSFKSVVQSWAPWIVLPELGTVPRWGAIAAIVVAMDACNWFVHLANHRVRALWRFHELHHSQEDMSVLTVFRTHPLVHVPYLVAAVPGLVLVANGALTTTVLVGYGAIVAFAHSNTRLGFGPLERVFVSPDYHRVHHLVDGPQDVNLGFALTIWDQLFRGAVFPTEDTVRADTGLAGRPLAVEQAPGASHARVFVMQLVAPFRPLRGVSHNPPVRSRAPQREGAHLEEEAA
jgi:sterol desaturase/sphingolipid hydroxylase (fatty acid hydroxylase superfamily)